MKLSLSSFIYFNYPLADAIIRTAQAGFEGIDIWGGRPHAYRRDLDEKDIVATRSLLENEGLKIASFIPAQFRYPTSLCSPIEKIRKDSVHYIQDSIETAAALGSPIVSLCPGHTLHGQDVEDGFNRLSESLWEISAFASRHDTRLAIEPADRYETDLLLNCTQAASFINERGLNDIGVLLDNGHEFAVGNTADDAVKALGDKLFHVHLDDNDGKRDQHLIPGEGQFDFAPFLKALRDIRYSGFLGIELGWDYTIDPDSAARKAYEQTRDLLSKID